MTQENDISHDTGSRHAYIECQCQDPGHVFRMELDVYDKLDEPELSLTMQMSPHPSFWRRIWHAFRYVFGMKLDYAWGGHWDSVVLDEKAVGRMQSMLVAWDIIRKLRRRRKGKGK